MQNIEYNTHDIEEFLKINEEENKVGDRATLKKLLSVQNKISIFDGLSPEELKAIVYDLQFVKYNFKDYIVKENDDSKSIFFILTGDCQVFVGRQRVGAIPAGSVIGEAGVLFKTKRNASVLCSSKSATVLSFAIDDENMEFCAPAIARLYKNLAFQLNSKIEGINAAATKK